jgi:hypothetical protein
MKRIVVPAEPTTVQVNAGVDADDLRTGFETAKHIYRAMLAVAPPYEPSEAEVEAAAEAIGRVLEETQGAGEVFNPRENAFDWRPELRVMARAALIAADEARRG